MHLNFVGVPGFMPLAACSEALRLFFFARVQQAVSPPRVEGAGGLAGCAIFIVGDLIK